MTIQNGRNTPLHSSLELLASVETNNSNKNYPMGYFHTTAPIMAVVTKLGITTNEILLPLWKSKQFQFLGITHQKTNPNMDASNSYIHLSKTIEHLHLNLASDKINSFLKWYNTTTQAKSPD